MSADLFITIKSHYNTFTRAEKHIADYVLKDARSVLYMSITELANACHVGDTSVFRFCRHLGKSGYQDFKVDLAQAVSELRATATVEGCVVETEDSAESVIQKTFNNAMSSMQETCRMLSAESLETAVKWLSEAPHVCFFGLGTSSTSAMDARVRFQQVFPYAECQTDAYLQTSRASTLDRGDVAMIFSYTGSTPETVSIAKMARIRGARTICFSRFTESPMASEADLLFFCGGNDGPYQNARFTAKFSQQLILDTILTLVTRRCAEI